MNIPVRPLLRSSITTGDQVSSGDESNGEKKSYFTYTPRPDPTLPITFRFSVPGLGDAGIWKSIAHIASMNPGPIGRTVAGKYLRIALRMGSGAFSN